MKYKMLSVCVFSSVVKFILLKPYRIIGFDNTHLIYCKSKFMFAFFRGHNSGIPNRIIVSDIVCSVIKTIVCEMIYYFSILLLSILLLFLQ